MTYSNSSHLSLPLDQINYNHVCIWHVFSRCNAQLGRRNYLLLQVEHPEGVGEADIGAVDSC